MLGSAFERLLSNVAARAEGDVARIAVTVEATSDRASVSIAGDGAALSEVQRAPLRDVDAANRAGVGVALYFVATVLERIGADLAIEDGESRGTVVTVTLDRVDDR